jgi:hypothetical protein
MIAHTCAAWDEGVIGNMRNVWQVYLRVFQLDPCRMHSKTDNHHSCEHLKSRVLLCSLAQMP